MSTIDRLAAQSEAVQDMLIRQVEDRAIRRAWNSHLMPGEFLILPNYAGTGEPVFPPHSYWAGGATAEMVYAANSEQIEEMIHLLGLTGGATEFVGGLGRKEFLELHLGIRPAPQ
ncbi:hypothetical protein F5887DRAFT_1076806 [Amanita rubescens]|nr:hypothetical protein F5887DRAFT_1076806 [Amanita rubescens]